jgi:heptosyltransferase-3
VARQGQRRLLIRPGAIGDCILSLPALEAARSDYTEIWAPRPVLPLFRFADRTRAIADTGLDLVGVLDDARIPELESFDSIYSWYGANRPEFRHAVRHLPFTFFPALPIPAEGVPRIHLPPVEPGDFAVIHPFSGSRKKNWPIDRYREVASRLDMPVQWCAGPEEHLDGAVRIENLYDLACWLARARVYIGNDSGITHLAAAAAIPVVAIFVASDPRVWAPREPDPTQPRIAVLENPTVDAVLDAARRVMLQL